MSAEEWSKLKKEVYFLFLTHVLRVRVRVRVRVKIKIKVEIIRGRFRIV